MATSPIHAPMNYLATDTLPLEILEKLEFCYNYEIQKVIPHHSTGVSARLVILRSNYLKVFLILKTVFLKPLQNF